MTPPDDDPRPLARTSPPFEPAPVTLQGRIVRLEPLGDRHREGLHAIALDQDLWRWTRHLVRTPAEFDAYLAQAFAGAASGEEIPFVQVDVTTGSIAGMTRYHSIERAHRRLEVGYTWLAAPFQGAGHNAEAKLLLMANAFDGLGAHRDQLLGGAAGPNQSANPLALLDQPPHHVGADEPRPPGHEPGRHVSSPCRPVGGSDGPRMRCGW